MSELRLSPREEPQRTLDLAPLSPALPGALGQTAISRLKLRYGADTAALGDWFRVRGSRGADTLRIEGGGARLECVGAGLEAGTILVDGDAGDLAGAGLRNGRLRIAGDAGDYAGAGSRGGRVEIGGNAGAHAGGFLPTVAGLVSAGLDGGTVWVRGDAGAGAGARARRGLLIIGGRAGPDCAARIRAGTVLALGGCGARAGRGMRRGSLVTAARTPPCPDFLPGGTLRMQWLRILFHHLAALDPHLKFLRRYSILVRRYTGDPAVGGMGEVLTLTR